MNVNEYRQKLVDKLLSEMNTKRAFDDEGLKKFVAITTETLKKNKTENLDEALYQMTNYAFNVGFNEGLRHTIEITNKI